MPPPGANPYDSFAGRLQRAASRAQDEQAAAAPPAKPDSHDSFAGRLATALARAQGQPPPALAGTTPPAPKPAPAETGAGERSKTGPLAQPPSSPPVGSGESVVKAGECVSSI